MVTAHELAQQLLEGPDEPVVFNLGHCGAAHPGELFQVDDDGGVVISHDFTSVVIPINRVED